MCVECDYVYDCIIVNQKSKVLIISAHSWQGKEIPYVALIQRIV